MQLVGEKIFVLARPVELAGVPYGEFRVGHPTVGQWLDFHQVKAGEGDVRAVSLVSGVPEAAVRLASARPVIAAARHIAGFLRPARQDAPDDLSGPIRLELERPITHDGASITALDLREPTASEWIVWDKIEDPLHQDIASVVTMTGLPAHVVHQMLAGDLVRATRIIAHFLF